jgi:hypothetical protein
MKVTLDASGVTVDNWGQFAVRKKYKFPAGTYGYVIQTVERSIDAQVVEGPRLTTTEDVENFTTGKVKYASGTYSEIFPILDGVGVYDDLFSGGAILQYNRDRRTRTWYADDEPPTYGTIRMVGTNRFFPTDKETAESIVSDIQARDDSRTRTFQDVVWTLNRKTPAAGLPYNSDYRVLPGDSEATHEFEIRWTSHGGATTVTSNVIRMRGARRKTRGRKKLRKYTRKAR